MNRHAPPQMTREKALVSLRLALSMTPPEKRKSITVEQILATFNVTKAQAEFALSVAREGL